MPPCIIFKISKPRNKTYSDHPPSPYPSLGVSVQNLVRKKGALVIQSYSGWNTSYIMTNYYIPHLVKNLGNKYQKSKSLFLFDNASCHKTEDVEKALDKNSINYCPLPPNSTPFLQPLDFLINRAFKKELRTKFIGWLDNNFTEVHYQAREEDSEENLQMKDYFKPPCKDEVVRWVLESFDDIKEEIVESSKYNLMTLLRLLGFAHCGLIGIGGQEKLLERIKQCTFNDSSNNASNQDVHDGDSNWDAVYITSESSGGEDNDCGDLEDEEEN